MPVMPAKTNMVKPPNAKSMAVVNRILPPQMVATQAKTLMPVGTEISIVVAMKIIRIQLGVPLAYI